ncbi:TIR domain-containing protein [Nocardioides sp. CER19]|uniref:nSTAND1 domain-containing NTPase n=1 Tax=Nocardioides sp. CER19 TaxID=3038538 RepID=UPI00244BAEAB|nr:TIR domain-containing protein [Nocardioides sp. CER19]MDH2414454.1 TIR domain-containing protein [Nocardioides sp. CER19]
MSRIFLSHSSRNSAEAIALKRWLVEQEPGLADEIFLDLDRDAGIAPGERWKRALRQANERCEAVICLLSEDWESSSECTAEFRTAETLGKLILCARLEPLDDRGITREWQYCDLFVNGGPCTEIAVDSTGRSVRFQTDGLHRLLRGMRQAGIGAEQFAWPPADDPERSPYRGWEPLEEKDAAVFYGRDAQIVRGMDALRGMRASGVESLFVILGPSGVGKSSFLRAGLLPRIRRDDRHFLVAGTVRPGRDVLTGERGLAHAIHRLRVDMGLRAPALADVKDACSRGDALFVADLLEEARQEARRRLLGEPDRTTLPTVILPVDQAEELFSADAGPEAKRFLTLLASLVNHGDVTSRGVVVACTIRTDFYGSLQSAPELSRLKSVVFDELRPMPPANFKEVIVGPAQRATKAGRPLNVQTDLVERLQRDSAHGADSLPLLSLTLALLYEDYGSTGELTAHAYEAMGGMNHVVQTQVDSVLARDPMIRASQLDRLHRAFIPWLATINPDNDQPMRRVARRSDLPANARSEIDALVSRRLLVQGERDGEVFVEVALESLLRQWADLVSWLAAERDDLKEADNLERAAVAWEQNDRNAAWLLEGERLRRSESVVSKPGYQDRLAHTSSFLAASRTREDKRVADEEERKVAELRAAREKQQLAEAHAAALRRRARILRVVLAATVVIALVALAGFVRASKAQRDAADRAREATALRLAAEGQAMLAGARPGGELRGMQEMLAAQDLKHTADGKRAIDHSVVVQRDVDKIIEVGSPVRSVAVNPAGTLVASGEEDGSVRLWDANTGEPVRDLLAPSGGDTNVVNAVAFSRDERWVAAASGDGSVRWWDATTRRLSHRVSSPSGDPVNSVAFSPDSSVIATGGDDHLVRLWDVRSGEPAGDPLTGNGKSVNAVAFGPGGGLIASGGEDGTVRLWFDSDTGWRDEPPMTEDGSPVNAVAFSRDGRRLASAGDDRIVRVWDPAHRTLVSELNAHKNWVLSVAFSPDGKRLVSASADYTLLLWDVEKGKTIGDPLTGHGKEVFSAAFTRDGRRVVSGMGDGTIRFWSVRAALPIEQGPWRYSMATSADGRLIASGGDGAIQLWNPVTGTSVGELGARHQGDVRAVAFAPDGGLLASGGEDGTVQLWDVASRTPTGAPLTTHQRAVLDVAFSPDDGPDPGLLATAGADGSVRLWDVASGIRVGEPLRGHQGDVNAVAFDPGGRLLASAGADGSVRLWDVASRRPVGEPLTGHKGPILNVAFSPDGDRLVSAGADKTVRLWNVRERRPVGAPWDGHEAAVNSVAFSPDGRRVVSGSADRNVRVWDARTGDGIGDPLIGHWDQVVDAVFTPDDLRVLSGSQDGTIRTWPVPPDGYGALCAKLTQNPSRDEWRKEMPQGVDYHALCPGLPRRTG